MSRKKELKIYKNVMAKIVKGQTKMKPKIHFVLGSLALFLGVVGTLIFISFGVSILTFVIRSNAHFLHGRRFFMILSKIPWWASFSSILGLVSSYLLLKKYDFSYKKNFIFILLIILLSAIFAGWFLNYSGLDRIVFGRGLMRGFYQQGVYQNLSPKSFLKF